MTLVAPLALFLTVAWLSLLVTAPILPVPIAATLYGLGSVICHQLPARSFHLFGAQLPVCARCTGIYAGAAIGTLTWVIGMDRGRVGEWGLTPWRSRTLLLAGAAPTVITVVLEWLGLWRPSNILRAIAGLPFGLVVALIVTGAIATLHYERCAPGPRPPIAPNPPPPPT